ncbi:hypothetical protein XENTR_v10012431 [Xenopus tropicalis]|nr:hypothetical protein XENTR_v10012431 [Xenopus tropicalis]
MTRRFIQLLMCIQTRPLVMKFVFNLYKRQALRSRRKAAWDLLLIYPTAIWISSSLPACTDSFTAIKLLVLILTSLIWLLYIYLVMSDIFTPFSSDCFIFKAKLKTREKLCSVAETPPKSVI